MEGIEQARALATETISTLITWGSDFLIAIIFFAALFAFGWYRGRGPLLALLMSFYIAYAVYDLFPYASLFPASPASLVLLWHTGVFAVCTAAIYFIVRRGVSQNAVSYGTFGFIALPLLGAGFLLALAYQVFPVREVYTFTPAIDALFAPKEFFFWWFVAPIIGLFFLAR